MTPEFNSILTQFIHEISTRSADIAVTAAKHTGVFVSFYEVGKTITNLLGGIFK